MTEMWALQVSIRNEWVWSERRWKKWTSWEPFNLHKLGSNVYDIWSPWFEGEVFAAWTKGKQALSSVCSEARFDDSEENRRNLRFRFCNYKNKQDNFWTHFSSEGIGYCNNFSESPWNRSFSTGNFPQLRQPYGIISGWCLRSSEEILRKLPISALVTNADVN